MKRIKTRKSRGIALRNLLYEVRLSERTGQLSVRPSDIPNRPTDYRKICYGNENPFCIGHQILFFFEKRHHDVLLKVI